MPTRSDLARIHIAKKELRLDEATYRGILRERYHLESAADLAPHQVADLISLFRAKGWRPASSAQRGLIHLLWHKLKGAEAIRHGDDAALDTFIAHNTGKDGLRHLTVIEASRIIERLKKWLERAGIDGTKQ